jgi:hypothetical protein
VRNRTSGEEQRLLAVQLASSITVMNDEIARALIAILLDPAEPEDLRGRAAISLGPALEELDLESPVLDGFDDPEDELVSPAAAKQIRESLREAYRDGAAPKEVRRRALEASVRSPEEWHSGAVRAAYHSGDVEWQLTAVFCMAYVAGFDDEILEALESDAPELRYQAVRAAGNWALKRAWPHVRSIVRNEKADRELLLAAIEAVANIRPGQAGDVLSPLLNSDDEEVVEAVSEALGMAGAWDEEEDEW